MFRWLHDRNADAVVISGDITEQGLNTEIDYLVRIWNDAFPGGKAADGRKVEKFWVWGNHDYSDASYMRRMPPEKLAEQIKVSVFGDKDAARSPSVKAKCAHFRFPSCAEGVVLA